MTMMMRSRTRRAEIGKSSTSKSSTNPTNVVRDLALQDDSPCPPCGCCHPQRLHPHRHHHRHRHLDSGATFHPSPRGSTNRRVNRPRTGWWGQSSWCKKGLFVAADLHACGHDWWTYHCPLAAAAVVDGVVRQRW